VTTDSLTDWLEALTAGYAFHLIPRAVLRWENPPEVGVRACMQVPPQPEKPGEPSVVVPWQQMATELRAFPLRWAVLYEGDPHVAGAHAEAVRTGRHGFRYQGDYESTVRKSSCPGVSVVYARFIRGLQPTTNPTDLQASGYVL
jgi:hypothetical protein